MCEKESTMKRFVMTVLAASIAALSFATENEARADVPPPNGCPTAGQACKTGGPKYDQAGTCTASKCQKSLPSEGGLKSVEYDCNLCVASGATTAASVKPADTTSPTPADSSGDAPAAFACVAALAVRTKRRR
jgi:hypothetical protein